MKVSIIIRTYNRAYILAAAIKSALSQTFQDFEIIVVDDASTDGTADVVRGFQDDRIKLVRHDRNRGVAAACNTGVKASKGEFIAWLDSDDTWTADKLERQVEFLSLHPEIDAAFSDTEINDGPARHPSLVELLKVFPKLLASKPKANEFVFDQREMYLCLLEEVPIKPTVLIVRREIFSKVGMFDAAAQSGEDWEFLLRLSHQSRFGYVNFPLAVQKWMPDATHQRFFEEDRKYLLQVFLREKAKARRDIQALRAINRAISLHSTSLAYRYLSSGKRTKAIKTYLWGFRQTGHPKMLVKAAAALMPLSTRAFVARILRNSPKPQDPITQ